MKTIRIGNDIDVLWKIYSRDGSRFPLEGKETTLWLVSGPLKKKITDYTVSTYTLSFSLDKNDLMRLGVYKLVLSILDEASETEDAAFDVTEVFQIVSRNYIDTANGVLDENVVITPVAVLNNIVSTGLPGKSAYDIAVDHGYEGTEEEWLNDPINGIKGVGIDTITGTESSESSGTNAWVLKLTDGREVSLHTKNGKGVVNVVQETIATASDGMNVIRVDYSDGTADRFIVMNGSKGNSGVVTEVQEGSEFIQDLIYNGLDASDAEEDATKVLSAYQGYVLEKRIIEYGFTEDMEPTDAPYRVLANGKYGTNSLHRHGYLRAAAGDVFVIGSKADGILRYAFATSYSPESGEDIPLVDGTSVVEIPASTKVIAFAPDDCYLLIYNEDDSADYFYLKRKLSIDDEPTKNSPNFVRSGGVDADLRKSVQIAANTDTKYNDDASVYFGVLYCWRSSKPTQDTIMLNTTIQPLEGSFAYVLTEGNSVSAKAPEDVLATDVYLLRYNSSHQVIGGYLYSDYASKLSERNVSYLYTTVGTTYYEDASVHFSNIYIYYFNWARRQVNINSDFQPIEGAFTYVLTSNNQVVAKAAEDILSTDLRLLAYNSSHAVIGGLLYTDYVNKKPTVGVNPYLGKLLVANGPSTIYGTTVTNRNNVFTKLVANALGMSHINYGIGGSTIARRSSDYDDVFLDYDEWEEAVSGGTLDTTKKYLVKDNINTPERPYHIYSYSDGSWVASGNTAAACGRTPLVDRIKEMDSDADVIILQGGGNDWAYMWTEMGDDSSRNPTDFCGALHKICQYLVETYPKKVILWLGGFAAWRYQPSGISGATWDMTTWDAVSPEGYKSSDYVEQTVKILRQYGIEFFDIGAELTFSQIDHWWCGDTDGKYVHPNAEAQQYIADIVANKLLSMKR